MKKEKKKTVNYFDKFLILIFYKIGIKDFFK